MSRKTAQPPHVFAVADAAYQALMGLGGRPPGSQCILIRSGGRVMVMMVMTAMMVMMSVMMMMMMMMMMTMMMMVMVMMMMMSPSCL